MPFPSNLEQLLSSGYTFLRSEVCSECGQTVEIFSTPGKREIALEAMCEMLRPAVRHIERCNIAPIPNKIKMFGVTDKNMIACGWLDGTLEIAFRHGRYQYAKVPENIFITLHKNPFPNNYFTKVVKNHPELYPFTKVG